MYPIAKELNRRGICTVFSTYLDGLAYARQYSLPTFEATPIKFRVTNEGRIDFKLTAATSGFSLGIRTFLRQLVRELRFMQLFRPDIVFSDSRASSLLAARLLRLPVVLMLNQFRIEIIRRPSQKRISMLDKLFFVIANIGWLFIRTSIEIVWARSENILIPDLPNPHTISLGNLAIPKRYNGKMKLIGPIVVNQRSKNSNVNQLRQELRLTLNKNIVYAAISGPRVEREVLSQMLLKSLRPVARKYQVILSRGKPEGSPRSRSVAGLLVFDWISNQDDYIKASDIIVSRAGHGTIMKSLVYGVPMILIPIPDHPEQYSNARRAESLGVAKVIDQNKINSKTLDSAIAYLLAKRRYRENAKKIQKSVSSLNAVETACDLIEHLAAARI
jgi:UDP:flavonoid glycosyltransferase YjiC (YdhE family)